MQGEHAKDRFGAEHLIGSLPEADLAVDGGEDGYPSFFEDVGEGLAVGESAGGCGEGKAYGRQSTLSGWTWP
ncbi:hypothetical protein ABZW10_14420 [Kitasatospora sp. NPDC004723]|uniref:hypothetical protein n=1 Tax=Kitasatospora sp. NPDC004723 TaxID=3154288 RepID=UPI0033BEE784